LNLNLFGGKGAYHEFGEVAECTVPAMLCYYSEMEISQKQAKRIFLSRQGLLRNDQYGRGSVAVGKAIQQLSWLQIDTISVVQRAHHHVLRSRISNYEPQMLHKLQVKDRQLFE